MGRRVLDIVVLAPDADGSVPALPQLTLAHDPDDRLLPPVQAAVRATLGVDRPALEAFVPQVPEALERVPVLLVLAPCREPGAAAGTARHPALVPATLPSLLRARAATWIDELQGRTPVPVARPAWARPGWHDGAGSWLDDALARAGRPRGGRVEQQRTWSLSTLLRTEAPGGAVWLKACMRRFHAEPPLGHWLWERLPDAVPDVLAVSATERLLLLEEMDGPTVKDAGGEESAPDAPAALARIARRAEGHLPELRALGLHDRPLAHVPGLVRRVLLGPDPVATGGLSPERARAVVAWVEREAADLVRLPVPSTLVHGDFHAGNLAWHQGSLRIFDWSDAVVGHPLMDAAAWIGEAPDEPTLLARWEAWVDAWSARVPPAELRPRVTQVLGVGAAHQLISLDGILRAMEPALRHTLEFSAIAYAAILDRLVPRDGGRGS